MRLSPLKTLFPVYFFTIGVIRLLHLLLRLWQHEAHLADMQNGARPSWLDVCFSRPTTGCTGYCRPL